MSNLTDIGTKTQDDIVVAVLNDYGKFTIKILQIIFIIQHTTGCESNLSILNHLDKFFLTPIIFLGRIFVESPLEDTQPAKSPESTSSDFLLRN